MKSSSSIPDVAVGQTTLNLPLDHVGMSRVFVPIQIKTQAGPAITLNAFARITINLVKKEARGIHMSRLYLICQEMLPQAPLSQDLIASILQKFLHSQENLCDTAYLDLEFELPLLRKALITDIAGRKSYPITLRCEYTSQGQLQILTKLRIDYSSTCPCSSALSRSYIQERFYKEHSHLATIPVKNVLDWLKEHGLLATPHGQRSHAFITLSYAQTPLSFESWIDDIENTLSTPTLTAVKRQDEQRFAVLSAQNPMFAEDAARRLAHLLLTWKDLHDFDVEVFHYESLHSHDAYAHVSRSHIAQALSLASPPPKP